MDPETKREFDHVRENFQKTFQKLDETRQCLQDHVIEDKDQFADLSTKLSLMSLGNDGHARESEQRTRSLTSAVNSHIREHEDRKRWVYGIIASLIVAGIIAMGTTVWSSIKAAERAEMMIQELKKKNGGDE